MFCPEPDSVCISVSIVRMGNSLALSKQYQLCNQLFMVKSLESQQVIAGFTAKAAVQKRCSWRMERAAFIYNLGFCVFLINR